MEIFNVWSTFNLKGDALEKIKRFSILAQRANEKITLLEKNIGKLEKSLGKVAPRFAVINDMAAKLNPEMANLSRSFVLLGMNANSGKNGISALNQRLDTAGRKMGVLSDNTRKLGADLRIVADESSAAVAGLSGMATVSNLSTEAQVVASSHRRRTPHLSHLGAVGMGGLSESAGFLGMASGYGIPLIGLAGAAILTHQGFEQEKEYNQYTAQLRTQGFTPQQIDEANTIASKTSPGISQVANIRAIVDAQMATRNWEEAKKLAPILAQAKFGATAVFGGMSDQQEQDLIRFAEIMGGSDTNKIAQWMDTGVKMMSTSGGSVMPTQQRTFARQGAGSLGRLTELGYLGLEPVIQEMGGQKRPLG